MRKIDLQLKCQKKDIVYSNEFTETTYKKDVDDNFVLDEKEKPIIESQEQLVVYHYKSGEIAPKLDNEMIEKRTPHIITRNLGGNKRSAQSGYNFYKEGKDWKQMKSAIVSKEVFDKAL